jgi:YceI-like protein
MNTKTSILRMLIVAGVVGGAGLSLTATPSNAGPIDVRNSKLTVFVYKAGLFSAFADNHVISAPIASGTITTTPAPAIELVVNAAELVPLDPDLDPSKRNEVRTRMLGNEVLDTEKFPTITFASTAIEPAGPDRWNVSGRLTIHGVTRAVTFPVVKADRVYRGETRIRQRDFGINPIRIAGGTVSVKDELKVEFQIADEHELRHSRTEACPPCERVRPTSACRRADRDDQCDSVLIRVLYPC